MSQTNQEAEHQMPVAQLIGRATACERTSSVCAPSCPTAIELPLLLPQQTAGTQTLDPQGPPGPSSETGSVAMWGCGHAGTNTRESRCLMMLTSCRCVAGSLTTSQVSFAGQIVRTGKGC